MQIPYWKVQPLFRFAVPDAYPHVLPDRRLHSRSSAQQRFFSPGRGLLPIILQTQRVSQGNRLPLYNAGAYLLLLGLCFEPFQDGIKKDPTTFSYFFVTSGLAFLALLFLSIVCDYFRCVKSTRFLVMSGQNPMIAYVVGDLLIMPLANILGIASLLSYFQQNAWLGFLQGVILTSLAVLVTMFFTKIKWFWRT